MLGAVPEHHHDEFNSVTRNPMSAFAGVPDPDGQLITPQSTSNGVRCFQICCNDTVEGITIGSQKQHATRCHRTGMPVFGIDWFNTSVGPCHVYEQVPS